MMVQYSITLKCPNHSTIAIILLDPNQVHTASLSMPIEEYRKLEQFGVINQLKLEFSSPVNDGASIDAFFNILSNHRVLGYSLSKTTVINED